MKALEGIRVLDLSTIGPGPFCTMFLADMGADVIMIEYPGTASERRAGGEQAARAWDEVLTVLQSPFNALNRNKRSLALNLKNEGALGIFYRLVESADIVLEQFRPGVAKRLGIDYETLKQKNPRIVYCAITGYGQDGPYAQWAGHDINYISIAGALGLIGSKDGDPVLPLNLLGDYAGGALQGAIGILSAIVAREKTGAGQFVDISMTDAAVSLLTVSLSEIFRTGEIPKRGEAMFSGIDPYYAVYPTKDGKYISLGSVEPYFYAKLCRSLGREDLIPFQRDPEKQERIRSVFREIFLGKTRDEWVEMMTGQDVCLTKVNEVEEISSDPQLRHRNMIVELDHPTQGKVKQVGIPIKLSDTPGEIKTFAPSRGQHITEILQELGYDQMQIEKLRRSEAIGG
ncbi:MAG: CaiB/BaiF CoA-transferase family protein [Dehalococcoidia bacterium]